MQYAVLCSVTLQKQRCILNIGTKYSFFFFPITSRKAPGKCCVFYRTWSLLGGAAAGGIFCFSVLDDFGKWRIVASSPWAMGAKSNLVEHVSLDYCCTAFSLYQSRCCPDNRRCLGSEWVIESVQAPVNWSELGFSERVRGKGITELNLPAVRARAHTCGEEINMFPSSSLKTKTFLLQALK